MNKELVLHEMLLCEQTKGQNVLQHGEAVHSQFCHFLNGTDNWKLPKIVIEKRDIITQYLLDFEDIKQYQIYHDCGKPFCRVIDDQEKVHFPNHAEKSYEIAQQLNFNETVCNLIKYDMFFHTCSANELEEKLLIWDIKFINILFITALAEIHANANMFGGIDSTSFKIKWKQLDRRSKYLYDI